MAAYAALHLTDDGGIPITPAAHHWLWLRLLCDERITKLLIIAPPESAKTTWAISAYLGCRIGFWPEQSIIIGSVSGPVAEKRALGLRAAVESAEWQATFPDILPIKASKGAKWETNEWSLAPGGKPRPGRLHPTVAAYGTGGSVIGARADLVLADDLLDFDNSRTAHQRGLVETWLHTSLLSRLKSKTGRAIMIGTAWHTEDIYAKARREGNWVVCHIPLLSDGELVYANLTYPDTWPYEMLGDPASDPARLQLLGDPVVLQGEARLQ
ncbi:MAG: hypothetical protein QMD04_08745 [Anaerolineales bacterium]|nr:hypothetical protein [Anaerolineales bacterium]